MITSKVLDYGSCPCGGTYESRFVEVRMNSGAEPVVLSVVPQGFCPSCGSRVYKAEILERLEAIFHGESDQRLSAQDA